MPIILSDGTRLHALDYGLMRKDFNLMKAHQDFLDNAVDSVDETRLLYVGQRELATVKATDSQIDIIGSDDSTTCHIVIVVDLENGNCSLSHFDGSDTSFAFKMMMQTLKTLNPIASNFALYLVGGFEDDRHLSLDITNELFDIFNSTDDLFHLKLGIVTKLNDTIKNGVHFPIVYGIGYDIKHSKPFMCNLFKEKGPDLGVRNARHFSSNGTINIYDTTNEKLMIGPFSYKSVTYVKEYIKLPDEYLLKYFSTSPEQEPPHFLENLRISFQAMIDHPRPLESYFKDRKTKVYSKQANGTWKQVIKK